MTTAEIDQPLDQVISPTRRYNSPAGIILQRRLIQQSFEAWCRWALLPRNESPAAHHLVIINTLQAVTRGELKRVILLMPPGSAKSTYTSILFPPWWLNQNPRGLILACSYSYSLIEGFGRQCRDLIEEHENVLGLSLSATAAASGDWRVTAGGGYFCAGVNAGIAGHRADLGFVDDYLGTELEANSEVTRQRNYDWYRKDFVPRLKPQAARVIIANRRHEEDLVGRLLAEEGDEWTVLKFPMLAEEENDVLGRKVGDRLWPEWFTEEMVKEAKKDSTTWAGLYQQRPSPEEGNYFKKKNIDTYLQHELPQNLRFYVGADYAVRKGQNSDFYCYLTGGVDSEGVLWILPDWYWEQADSDVAVEEMLNLAAKHRPITWWAGRENITGSLMPFIQKRQRERQVYIAIEEQSEAKDKEQKAQPIKARMGGRATDGKSMVRFPAFAKDWEKALNQLLMFPNGKHDDFVDALAKLGQGLGQTVSASVPKEVWNGIVPQTRLTCGWLQRSAKRKERASRMEVAW